MPIPLGIFATAGAGGGGAAFELISTQVLTGSASSVTFSSIPATYKHLQIRAVVLGTTGNGSAYQFNGDGGSNYAQHRLWGQGGSVLSGATTSTTLVQVSGFTHGYTTGNPAAIVIDILDYANTSKNTTSRHFFGNATPSASEVLLGSGLWINTSVVTSFTFFSGANLNAGSRFSLYGIKG